MSETNWQVAGAEVDHGPYRPVATLIEEQTDRTPGRIALVHRGETETALTYAKFDALANGLAAELTSAGVREGDLVPLMIGNSVELPLCMVALMKLGAVFVPCDPAWPEERLRTVLQVLAPPLALTSGSLVRADGRSRVVSHRAIVNRLLWMQRELPLTAEDRVLQKTPYSFDASIWEIFLPLLTGARLVVAEPGGHRDCSYLLAVVAGQGVTVLQLVPSMFSVFLAEGGLRERGRSLRRIFCGGEALPAEAVERSLTLLEAELCNLYGPTEATVDVTAWTCTPEDGALIPIGRPISNTQIHILDEQLQLLPQGAEPIKALHSFR